MNAFERNKIGFSFNTEYEFKITISSESNPYKIPVTESYFLKFEQTFEVFPFFPS